MPAVQHLDAMNSFPDDVSIAESGYCTGDSSAANRPLLLQHCGVMSVIRGATNIHSSVQQATACALMADVLCARTLGAVRTLLFSFCFWQGNYRSWQHIPYGFAL